MQFSRSGSFQLIARLSKFEQYDNEFVYDSRLSRTIFEFDAINAEIDGDTAQAEISGDGDGRELALLKVLTTKAHFENMALGPSATEGQWYKIDLVPRGSVVGPLAWASTLDSGGYLEPFRFSVGGLEWLPGAEEKPLRPMGADVAVYRQLAHVVAEACKFPKLAIGRSKEAGAILAALPVPHRVVVRDVGQASFVTALDEKGKALFHLDAGWPISYNRHTAPAVPILAEPDIPVILSHWDWDHLHGFHAIAGLKGGVWIAPVQPLGPGAQRVANILARNGRLHGFVRKYMNAGFTQLGRCCGTPKTLNSSGIAVRVTLENGSTVMFAGDADYDYIHPKIRDDADYLIVAHHGSRMIGSVPSPRSSFGVAVASVGKGNSYGHPNLNTMRAHIFAGWSVCTTSDHCHGARGPRVLDPIRLAPPYHFCSPYRCCWP